MEHGKTTTPSKRERETPLGKRWSTRGREREKKRKRKKYTQIETHPNHSSLASIFVSRRGREKSEGIIYGYKILEVDIFFSGFNFVSVSSQY